MRVNIEVDVKDCRDCPFRKHHQGHGECWEYCSHPNRKTKAYGDILWGCQGAFVEIPDWCPIIVEDNE